MALEEFEKEEMNGREKSYIRMRSIMDLGMGLLWTAMGIFMIFIEKFNPALAQQYHPNTFKIFGAVCIIYGLFRVYRGVKKNYFRDK